MNLIFYPFFLIASTTLLIGCGETFEGDITLSNQHSSFSVYESGTTRPVNFQNGSIKVTVRSEGTFNEASLELTQEKTNSKATISLPSDVIKSSLDFAIQGEEVDQEFDIVAEVDSFDHGEVLRRGTVSCTYIGYCTVCSMGADGKQSCGYKHSSACPGHREALLKDIIHFEAYTIKFLDQSSQEPMAVFRAEPIRRSKSEVIEYIGACGG